MNLSAAVTRKNLLLFGLVAGVLALVGALLLTGVLSVSVGVLGGTGDPPPQGGFHAESGNGTVTFIRDVGAPVNASKLEIRVDDRPRGTWDELAADDGMVNEGDRLTVENVGHGEVVSLYWLGGDTPKKLVSHHD